MADLRRSSSSALDETLLPPLYLGLDYTMHRVCCQAALQCGRVTIYSVLMREGLSEIAAPAKNSDTELTAIKLGWTCQIVIEDRGTGELNKGLVRDSAGRS